MGKQWKQCQTLFSGAPKSLQMVTAAMKLKDAIGYYEWNDTEHTRHTRDRQDTILARNRTACAGELMVYLYTSPLGRIPDCMTKLVQYSACAQMLSYSKREWNSGLLQSLSRALITRRECSLICKGPLISRLCPSPWQNILFASSTSPLSLLWPH